METELKKFGLSEKEATVYLALMTLGSGVVTDIANHSNLNRSTTYIILDSLQKQGLVSVSDDQNSRTYTAAAPEKIVQIAEQSVKKYTDLVGIAHSIVPELKSLYRGVGLKPKIQFFHGTEGIKTAFNETLHSTEDIRAYASIDNLYESIPDFFPNYFKQRARKKIKIRAIFPDTPQSRERSENDKEELRESKLIKNGLFPFSCEINIFDNKILFASLKERFALIIESSELSMSLKNIFDLSWYNIDFNNIHNENK